MAFRLDASLQQFATPRQWEQLKAWETHGSQQKAAVALGIHPSIFGAALRAVEKKAAGGVRYQTPIVENLPPPDPEQRPTVRVRMEWDTHEPYKVLAIGDAHDGPKIPDKSRFRWLGCLAREKSPDIIVQIGDLLTLDSLCKYDDNATVKGQQKPTFMEDMESGEAALTAFDEGLDGYECKKHVCLGNHEDRIFSFTDRHPEIAARGNTAGVMQLELDRLLGRHGWTYSPFGHPHFIGGVGFIHVPMSIMGRPMGGELLAQNTTNKATHDWVFGHDHRAAIYSRPKIGMNNKVTAIDLGCALPEGHIEPYATVSTTGWWYGAWLINIARGKIQSARQISMGELKERYA